MKPKLSTELCYLLGIVILAFGTALMTVADFGVSMIVAPAYLLHLKLSETFSFFTFGTAEYVFQGVLLIVMALVLRRFRLSYLFSFATAVLYGFTLDGMLLLVGLVPAESLAVRILFYLLGMLVGSVGVALFFHTYISPEVYELFVAEVSAKFHVSLAKFKTGFDCVFCLIAVILSFVFFGFGHFEGVKLGTILCALINGSIIGFCSSWIDRHFTLTDVLPWRKYFKG